jgi:hypothetical protein
LADPKPCDPAAYLHNLKSPTGAGDKIKKVHPDSWLGLGEEREELRAGVVADQEINHQASLLVQ